MRYKLLMAALVAASTVFTSAAQAKIIARVNLASQTMNVYVNGALRHSWRVSSGRSGYNTPRGSYRPTVMRVMHYSRKYNNSPMPHSIFFRGGYAIHGTGAVSRLGRPASHGCVRLSPGNAARLYSLVKAHGAGNTRIIIGGGRAPQVASYRKRAKRTKTVYRASRGKKRSYARKRTYRTAKKRAVRKKWSYTFGVDS